MATECPRQHTRRRKDLWSRVLNIWLSSLEREATAELESPSSTAELTMISTATVFGTTILQTTLITITAQFTPTSTRVRIPAPLPPSCTLGKPSPSSPHVQFPNSTLTPVESVTSAAPPLQSNLDDNASTSTSPPLQTRTITMVPERAPSNASENSTGSILGAPRQDDNQDQFARRAIVGGLSGSIAGLLFVGVIICLFLRRRRRKRKSQDWNEQDEKQIDYNSPPQLPPILPVRSHSPATVGRPSTSQPAVDEDHRIIRMSTQHWPRPYAPGGAEGHRRSRSRTQLRIMNPDPSRPQTPRRPSTDTTRTGRSYLSKKRLALSDVLHGAATRLRASSFRTEYSSPAPPPPIPPEHLPPAKNNSKPLPTIKVIDRTLSRDLILRTSSQAASSYAPSPSFRSYPSLSTIRPAHCSSAPARSPSINYIPPSPISPPWDPAYDPFQTPPLETQTPKVQRPALATLQSAARGMWPTKVRKSTLGSGSSNSGLLTPSFRRHASQRGSQARRGSRGQRQSHGRKDASVRGQSELSINTSTTAQWSARSDPFDLDRGSWRDGRRSLGFGFATTTTTAEERKGGGGEGGEEEKDCWGGVVRNGAVHRGIYEGT